MKFQSILAIAVVAWNASMTETEAANPLKKSAVAREIMAAKRRGASKTELMKLKEQLRDEIRVAKAAGVSHETLRKAQARGATLNDIKAKVNLSNLNKKKKRGIFKKKEVTISSILFPGVSPVDYTHGEPVDALVDVVTSQKTQLPIDYYRLPVCEPKPTAEKFRGKTKNLGERLAGKSQLKHSPYPFTVMKNHGCKSSVSVSLTARHSKKCVSSSSVSIPSTSPSMDSPPTCRRVTVPSSVDTPSDLSLSMKSFKRPTLSSTIIYVSLSCTMVMIHPPAMFVLLDLMSTPSVSTTIARILKLPVTARIE